MWLPTVTIVQPQAEPVDLDRAKASLRVDDDGDDALILSLITVARTHVEALTGLRLLTQTIVAKAGFFADLGHFEVGPVQSVTEIAYQDGSGASHVLDPDAYEITGAGLTRGVRPVAGGAWPRARGVDDAITVTAIAGYGDPEDVPAAIAHAMLLLVGDWYANREDTIALRSVTPAALPNGVMTLLANFRLF